MKKILLMFMVLVMVVTTVACGNDTSTPDNSNNEATQHTFYYATYSDPILQWDPSGSVSNEVMVFNNIYETLLGYNPTEDEFEYKLATDYSVSEDGLIWTFNLREGVKFTDGSDFNAEVVKFCFERTKTLNGANAYLWECLDYVEVVDNYTAEFHLKYPAAVDIICAGSYGSYIYSMEAITNNGDDYYSSGNACGTGPYQLSSYQSGDYVVLSKNEDYWGGWSDNQYDSVIFKYVAESSSRRQMIESGEASVVNMLPAEDVAALESSNTCRVVEAPTLKNMLVMFNTAYGPCSDPDVRKALSYAIPYESVVEVACGGHATVSNGNIPVGLWGHSDDIAANT